MKTSEKIFTGIVLSIIGLMIVEVLYFELMMISRAKIEKPEMVPFWHFISGILLVQAISLGIPAFWNMKHQKLGTVATVIQICSLLLNTIGFPFGIWGIVLLVKRNKNANQNLEPIVKTPADKVEAQSTQAHV